MNNSPRQFSDKPAIEWMVFPKNTNYAISSCGLVKRIHSDRYHKPVILKPQKMTRGGYLQVGLSSFGWKHKKWPIHQLVLISFAGDRPTMQHHAAHNDGNKENNHISNLSWKTRKEIEADKIRHGTTNRGERNGSSKLSTSDILKIRTMRSTGTTQREIASSFAISRSLVGLILTNKRWRHVV